jgi:OFA family oxalate/formate antiporter-like MFS transporter
VNKRLLVALAAILTMLGPGALYSYSLLAQPLSASFEWTSVTTTWGFAIANFFLGLGGLAGGIWLDRMQSRRVAITGTLLWAAGNVMTGLGTESLGAPFFYLCYGVIGGFGCGMVAIAALTTVIGWFPKRRGMGGGLVAMGFGLGAVYYNQVLEQLPSFLAIRHAANAYLASQAEVMSPSLVHALMHVFIVSGAVFAVVGLAGASLLQKPSAEFAAENAMPNEARLGQTISNPQFYLLWLILFLNVLAGIAVISNAVPIISEVTNLPAGTVAGWYAIVAVFNGLGCFVWGVLSDRVGRRGTFVLLFLIQAFAFMMLDHVHSPLALLGMFSLILLCYGGGFGVMPAFNADFFGLRHFGANYGLNVTAWGAAAIVGPWFASTVKDLTGSFSATLLPLALILFVALIIPLITDNPAEREKLPEGRPTPA